MRAFLGLEPDVHSRLAITSWRDKTFPPFEYPVPASNFHITLAFLGQISAAQQDRLETNITGLTERQAFSVTLDEVGYWPKPKALWLGCKNTAAEHVKLVTALNRCARSAGISLQKRPYQAHLTLVRKCAVPPPAPLIPPLFSCQVQAFHLFESMSTAGGVVYVIRKTWQLHPRFAAGQVR